MLVIMGNWSVLLGALALVCVGACSSGSQTATSEPLTASPTPAGGASPEAPSLVAPSPVAFIQRLVVVNDTTHSVRVSCRGCRTTTLSAGERGTFDADEDFPAVFEGGGVRRCQAVGPRTGGRAPGRIDENGVQTVLVSDATVCD